MLYSWNITVSPNNTHTPWLLQIIYNSKKKKGFSHQNSLSEQHCKSMRLEGKSYFVVQVLHIKVIWLLPKERDSPKSRHKIRGFVCVSVGSLRNHHHSTSMFQQQKGAESNNYVSIQRCLISVSDHLAIKPSCHQSLFWTLMVGKLFCQFFNLSNAKVYILQAYTCILTICITKNILTHLMQGSSIRIERLVFGLTLNSNKLDEKVKILSK